MDDLKDKVALVTGGGSGINLAFIKLLHDAGCKVLIADIALHADASQWLSTLPKDSPVAFQRTDVTDWPQLEAAFDACNTNFNTTPDIVVPGAGVYEPSSNSFWKDNDRDSRYKVLDINLVHPIKMTRIAIRRLLKAKKSGIIIHVSSIAAQRSSIITPLYQASKHGVSSVIRGMAPLQELVGIKVVGVAPGTVASPLFMDHPEASKFLDMEKDYLLPPGEIAKAMFSLLTDHKYKSGTILEVCEVDNWREVSLLNDPGPQGPASRASKKHEAIAEVLQFLREESGNSDLGLNGSVQTD